MTQAHETAGAIVVLKDEWKFDLDWLPPGVVDNKWEVLGLVFKGHIHVRSLFDPKVELPGFHSERFKTYRKR